MKIKIIAKTDKGAKAIEKLSLEDTEGRAFKEIINISPLTLQIVFKGVNGIAMTQLKKSRPKEFDNLIKNTWISVIEKYDATAKDIKVISC